MQKCLACQLQVDDNLRHCPLCQNHLTGEPTAARYPTIKSVLTEFSFLFKLLLFLSLGLTLICLIINFALPQTGFWSLYVVIGLVYFWLTLTIALRQRHSLFKNIILQTIFLIAFAILFDLITGWHRWSLNFFVPIGCSVALITIHLMAWIKKVPPISYLLYLLMFISLGFIPLILLLLKIITVPLPTLICLGFNLLILLQIIIFQTPILLSELKRRFHW